MPRTVLEYKCLLISPSDVKEERLGLTKCVELWNAQIGDALGAKVELVKWETHSSPEMSGEPQQVLNQQIVDHCDLGVAVFWYRLGTPTKNHESGSIEEIDRMSQSGKRVLVYFCSRAIPQEALDGDQFSKLQLVKKSLQEKGLLGSYNDAENLIQQFQLHLTKVISELLSKDKSDISHFQNLQPVTLPKPDIRIKIKGGFAGTLTGIEDILIIEVQNHSPMTVFLGNVVLRLKTGNAFFAAYDAITKEYQKRRELRPGQNFSFNMSPQVIIKHTAIDDIICASVSDDIERTYESKQGEIPELLKSILERNKNA